MCPLWLRSEARSVPLTLLRETVMPGRRDTGALGEQGSAAAPAPGGHDGSAPRPGLSEYMREASAREK
jgi:hypothetical protein